MQFPLLLCKAEEPSEIASGADPQKHELRWSLQSDPHVVIGPRAGFPVAAEMSIGLPTFPLLPTRAPYSSHKSMIFLFDFNGRRLWRFPLLTATQLYIKNIPPLPLSPTPLPPLQDPVVSCGEFSPSHCQKQKIQATLKKNNSHSEHSSKLNGMIECHCVQQRKIKENPKK